MLLLEDVDVLEGDNILNVSQNVKLVHIYSTAGLEKSQNNHLSSLLKSW